MGEGRGRRDAALRSIALKRANAVAWRVCGR
jgi:hypothetical protein